MCVCVCESYQSTLLPGMLFFKLILKIKISQLFHNEYRWKTEEKTIKYLLYQWKQGILSFTIPTNSDQVLVFQPRPKLELLIYLVNEKC